VPEGEQKVFSNRPVERIECSRKKPGHDQDVEKKDYKGDPSKNEFLSYGKVQVKIVMRMIKADEKDHEQAYGKNKIHVLPVVVEVERERGSQFLKPVHG
jgi:hypothetical protein